MLRTAVVVFLAAAAGIILFTSIQDEIPDELSILKTKGGSAGGAAVDVLGGPLPSKSIQQYQGWTVYADDAQVVLAAQLTPADPKGDAKAFVYIGCDSRTSRSYLTLVPLVKGKGIPGAKPVHVVWNQTMSSNWRNAAGRLTPQEPSYFLPALTAGAQLQVSFTLNLSKAAQKAADPQAHVTAVDFMLNAVAVPQLVQNLPAYCR